LSDTFLNPIRATVTLGLHVLSDLDVDKSHPAYQQAEETIAR
jgi:hypothetical protein